MAPATAVPGRVLSIDWVRGLAVIAMIQAHVFDSFTQSASRDGAAFRISQYLGGIAAPIFLFLVGVTLAFKLRRADPQDFSPRLRVNTALRRAGFLFLIAIAFRLQLWLFAWPGSGWQNLLRVDALNAMALGVAAISPLALFQAAARIRAGVVAGAAIAALAPLVAQAGFTALPAFLRDYFVPSAKSFAFFPCAAYVPFGLAFGELLGSAPATDHSRLMQWTGVFGLVLIAAGQYFSEFPYSLYAHSDFWLDSPTLIFIRLGVILVLVPVAYLWTAGQEPRRYGFLRMLGTSSLLIYWAHVELAYGRWFWFWKQAVGPLGVAAATLTLITLMWGLAKLKTRRWPPKEYKA